MIAMIVIAAVAFFVFSAYMAYIAGKEHGFYKGRREAYRELEHIIEHYKELADAKNTPTKGA